MDARSKLGRPVLPDRRSQLSAITDNRQALGLHRIAAIDDKGVLVGRYAQRRDVTRSLLKSPTSPGLADYPARHGQAVDG